MTFAEPADGGIAGHLADRVAAMGGEERARAEARGGRRRLAACMAAADHDDVVCHDIRAHDA